MGGTKLSALIRGLDKSIKWKDSVFERDNYTCQECNTRGTKLNAHHKYPFSFIFNDFLRNYNQFPITDDKGKLIKLAMKWEPFWDINNGITLCAPCHRKYSTRPKR